MILLKVTCGSALKLLNVMPNHCTKAAVQTKCAVKLLKTFVVGVVNAHGNLDSLLLTHGLFSTPK